MIPVKQQAEPANFNKDIREKGQKWMLKHPNTDPSKYKNYWTKCIPELRVSYKGICAYLAVYFEAAYGADTVDHFIPKSDPINGKKFTYEWSNYRLSCRGPNTKKNNKACPIDPFSMKPNSFFIDFSDGKVFPNPQMNQKYISDCLITIDVLSLNDQNCCKMRKSHYLHYAKGDWTDKYVAEASPFVWQEICRQQLKR